MIRAFAAELSERGIVADAAQQAAVARLQAFYDDLVTFKAARRSRLRKLLVHPALPKGVWFWGGVGRGKSFLMDCFFAAVPYQRKRRVHFHAFMREVHERLQAYKHASDPLAKVAAQVAQETRLMCFDEFHISDIADAMILARLMQALFEAGVLFCITSNYPPAGLYPAGLQRELVLPTLALLNEKLDVIEIDAGIDYRLRALEQASVYLLPADDDAAARLMDIFTRVAHGAGHARPIMVAGREIQVIHRAPGVLWMDFAVLCDGPRSQNDYLDIAHRFHTIFVANVPRMGAEMANAARRFTWLVDVCYDHRVKLVLAAAVPAEELYVAGPQAGEFKRTVSRLMEMRSHEYLANEHRRYETHAPSD
ncbi:MAG: AFG1 family ATPase [Gammaproteobacteria bacterium]|nr:AFG1 family ATPase [Rhodocyclaceae bacterium]MBU3907658.1 AFG1 family ATPase [Gammaproteobacteria bacterium]MBU3989203.1 AFG1 family ATPase [Gammaproteobacteria bacterium]MBU4004304.1 AFG1 family ATPase [Gammaproteobacteria bacterium]MBU4019713.1 AFG1 family ATPase [Gammaproteobacteria bacterium]